MGIFKKTPLNVKKITQASNAVDVTAGSHLPKGTSIPNLKQSISNLADRSAKELFKLLRASAIEKVALASHFFANIETRVNIVLSKHRLTYKDFGFSSQKEMSNYLKGRVARISVGNKPLPRFLRGMKGRKWMFIGAILFERYIKFGPVSKYLYDTADNALSVINDEISKANVFLMVTIGNKPVQIKKIFGKLLTGTEFILETDKGKKQFLDFGHVAFNSDGNWIIPTPVEIKLPWASEEVAHQFSRFVSRINNAKKLIIVFEKSDLEVLKKQKGRGVIDIIEVDEKLHVEVDRSKMVFDPNARNQVVVVPELNAWLSSGKPPKQAEIDIDVQTSNKDGGFSFWRFEVNVSREPFENLYNAIFLGF